MRRYSRKPAGRRPGPSFRGGAGRRTGRRGIPRVLLLAAVFVAAFVIAALVWRWRGPGSGGTEEPLPVAAEGDIPAVSFAFGEEYIDLQHGYLSPMDVRVMHGSILPIEGRTVRARVDAYGAEILSASYELLRPDGGLVAEAADLSVDRTGNGAYLSAEFPTLMQAGTEYVLRFMLSTPDYEQINYYTRVQVSDDLYLQEILDFARGFSDATFDREHGRDRILAYLESDMTVADNSDFGYSDLKNSYRQICWGSLSPQPPSSRRVTVHEIWRFGDGSTAAAVTMDYELSAADETGRDRLYTVREYYLMRQYNTITGYLLDWYRTVDDITPVTSEDVSEGRVGLGILSPDSLPPQAVSRGGYAVFEDSGRLWEYCPERRSLVLLYDPFGGDSQRPPCREQGYRIVSLDGQTGETVFCVYGYMDSGARQGRTGMALCRYSFRERELTELFFVESDAPYEILSAEVRELAGASTDGTYYFYHDQGIYAVYPGDTEPTAIARGLDFGSFAVSSDGTRVAWAEGRGTYGYGTVYMMDLEHGVTFDPIGSRYGEELLIQGFTGHDLVLGMLRPDDAGTTDGGERVWPMYALSLRSEIISSANRHISDDRSDDADGEETQPETQVESISLEEVTYYEPEGYFISSAETDDSHVTIRRLRRAGDVYVTGSDDSLLRTGTGSEEEGNVLLQSEEAEIRKTVRYLRLFDPADAQGTVNVTSAGRAEIGNGSTSAISGGGNMRQVFFAYARGRLVGVYGTAEEAAEDVYEEFGLVIDGSGTRVWSRLEANAAAAEAAARTQSDTQAEDGSPEEGAPDEGASPEENSPDEGA